MYSFRRIALLLALVLPALPVVMWAQSSSSTSSSSSSSTSTLTPSTQKQSAKPAPSAGELSVQARIRARRAQHRAAAIKAVYTHLYEINIGTGYQRFLLAAPLQRVNEYMWNVDFTRYYNERLGVTIDGRGTYGSAYLTAIQGGNSGSNNAVYHPAISQYSGMIGPTYRFYLRPRYSLSGRLLGGFSTGNFSGDTDGLPYTGPNSLGLYPDGAVVAVSASVVAEYNISPELGLRVAPEVFLTGYGGSAQLNRGFTIGLVRRFGKQ